MSPIGARPIHRINLVLVACLAGSAAIAAPWQGREEMRDGILHILNPTAPMETHRSIEPRELWRLGGESEADQDFFGMVEQIRLDADGNVYVLDVQLNEIRVFDPDGSYLRSIGREGEGPGDFRNANDFFILPDGRLGVVQLMPGRIAMMRTGGDGLADMPLPQGQEGSMMFMVRSARASRDLLILGRTMTTIVEGVQNSSAGLIACDHAGAVLGTWRNHATRREQTGTVTITPDRELSYTEIWDLAADNRCFLAPWYTGYKIEVLDGAGATECVIERDYVSIPRTDEEIAVVEERYADLSFGDRKLVLDINPMRRDIAGLWARPNGELWVLSSEGEAARAENSWGRIDVFDAVGHFVRTLSIELPYDPAYDEVILRDDRLFLLKEVNDGPRTISGSSGGSSMTMIMSGDGNDGDDDDREPEPFEIICYSLGD